MCGKLLICIGGGIQNPTLRVKSKKAYISEKQYIQDDQHPLNSVIYFLCFVKNVFEKVISSFVRK